MRIECDSCGAKYSIGDEKVAGRMLKVRCKKCGNMIRVDGTSLGSSDEATRVFDATAAQSAAEASMADADGAIWYVVLDGQQTGPLLASEVENYLRNGDIDVETFAWRDGLDDWQRIADIPELAQLAGSSDGGDDGGDFSDEATRVVSVDHGEQRKELPFGGLSRPASAAVERFPSASYQSLPAPTPQSAARGTAAIGSISGGAAGTATASGVGTGSGSDLAAGAPLVGQRNESSVLFSLSDLTAGTKPKKSDDLPRTEGSGLIDIRMLAGSTTAMKPAESTTGGVAPAAPAIAVAPLLPVPARRTSTGLIVGISLGAVAIIALSVALVVILLKEPTVPVVAADAAAPAAPTAAAPTSAAAPPAAPSAPAVAAAVPTTPPPAVPTSEGSGAIAAAVPTTDVAAAVPTTAVAVAAPTGTATEPDREEDRDERGDREERPATTTTTTTTPTSDTSGTTARPPTGSTERDPNAVANAIASIRQERDGDEPATNTTTNTQPEEAAPAQTGLDRDTIRATVRRYGSRIAACRPSEGAEVRFTVSWVIQPSGSVTNVSPSESSDTAQCVAGVIEDISFPRFDGEAQRVNGFPISF